MNQVMGDIGRALLWFAPAAAAAVLFVLFGTWLPLPVGPWLWISLVVIGVLPSVVIGRTSELEVAREAPRTISGGRLLFATSVAAGAGLAVAILGTIFTGPGTFLLTLLAIIGLAPPVLWLAWLFRNRTTRSDRSA